MGSSDTKKAHVNVNMVKKKRFLRHIAIALILLIIFLTFPTFCGGHYHDHDHDDHHGHSHGINERPSFKYSQEANKAYEQRYGHSHEQDSQKYIHEEVHNHDHNGHGHSHEGHGHSHEGHGHSHGDHGHSHDEELPIVNTENEQSKNKTPSKAKLGEY